MVILVGWFVPPLRRRRQGRGCPTRLPFKELLRIAKALLLL
jgi:hypothetical protein